LERWEALTLEQRQKFPPLTPDFLIELRSETDRLKPLQEKMEEYIDNGLRLGWLINPQSSAGRGSGGCFEQAQDATVEIYRLGKAVEVIQIPAIISGEDILPGFELQV
jgi:Uma2 family endonuclease